MNFFNYILRFFTKKIDTGVRPDNRHFEDKKKDFLHEEIVADATMAVYRTKQEVLPITTKYPKENQYTTLSCVAHGDTLALGIDNEIEGNGYVRLSKAAYYRLRSNYPGGGMNGDDSGQIGTKFAAPLFEVLPTPVSEERINQVVVTSEMIEKAKPYRAKNYVRISECRDIDILASVASQGKGVPIMIYATEKEWSQEYPKILSNISPGSAPIRHEVCILPNANFIENGVKYVTIQDSAHFGGLTIRYLSEDFIKQRVFYAKYFLNLENTPAPVEKEKPKHKFTQQLKFGMKNDEVLWLQKCLQYDGLFPSNVTPTGLFAGITLKAVKDFQNKYASEILAPLGLFSPTGIVGNATNAKLNRLFN